MTSVSEPDSSDDIKPEEDQETLQDREIDLDEDDYLKYSNSTPVAHFKPQDLKRILNTEASWPVNLVVFMVFLSGLAGTFQPLATRLAQHPKLFSVLVPYSYYHLSKHLTIAFGLFLIYLSFNLMKRKWNAWLLALLILSGSILLSLARAGFEYIAWLGDSEFVRSIPFYTLLIPVLAAVLLIVFRKQFNVKSEREKIVNGIQTLVISFVMVVAYGAFGFFLLDRKDFGVNFEWQDALTRTLREIAFIGNPDLSPRTKFGNWFIDSLHLYGALAAGFAAYSLFRPINFILSIEPKEHELAKKILEKHGADALDVYKLTPDKSYFFSNDKSSFIAYRTALNVAISLGDPAAPSENLEELLIQFKSFCKENDWRIAFLQVSDRNLQVYEKQGFKSLKVGEDAVVDLERFATKTVKSQKFKSKHKKFLKSGFTLEKHEPPLSIQLIDELEKISNQWLSLPGRKERGFSLGWFDRNMLKEDTVYVLKDSEGKALAFVNKAHSYAPDEVSIDMMRHCEEVPNGTMDFLFAELLLTFKEEGFKTFNLGLAALSGVAGGPDATMEEKAVHEIYEHMNRFFSYKGLRNYKEKFDPDWQERFLVYEGGTTGLIKTALAITKAGERD